jgi:hypothetical protein
MITGMVRFRQSPSTQIVEERRAGLIDRLLNAANKPGEKTKSEGTLHAQPDLHLHVLGLGRSCDGL